MSLIPLFKSTYSLKSILTLEKPGNSSPEGADSIFDIAKENNLSEIFLLENSMIGFKKAHELSKELGIQLIFGVVFDMCNNRMDEDKKSSAHKVNIFAKNDEGCKELMKIYSLAHTESEGFLDCETLRQKWSDNLLLCVPFYDSFIHNNALFFKNCLPDFSFTSAIMFLEDNDLPIDLPIREKVNIFAVQNDLMTQDTKTIYYKNRDDADAFITYKICTNRQGGKAQTLDRPELAGMSSREFCFQSFLEKCGQSKY